MATSRSKSGKSTKAPRAARKSPAKPVAAEPAIPAVTGSEEAFNRFLRDAQKLAPGDVLPYRADPALAHYNIKLGLDAVLAEEGTLKHDLPHLDWGLLRSLPDLALAVVFAAEQAERLAPGGPNVNLRSLQARGSYLREIMLDTAEVLAKKKLLPDSEVKKIRAGQGPVDSAQDLIALSNLFRRHLTALRGKSPITAEEIAEAADVGTKLLQILKPVTGRKKPQGLAEATDARNRLWTLLVKGHALLERTGGWLWGSRVQEHVPPLQSREGGGHKKVKTGKGEKTPKGPVSDTGDK